jgi:hypothetical protein
VPGRFGSHVFLQTGEKLAKPMNGNGFAKSRGLVAAVFENLARNLL